MKALEKPGDLGGIVAGRLRFDDVRTAYKALRAIGWTHAMVERLVGKRCQVCLSPRRRDNEVCLRCRTGGERATKLVVTATCPGCKREYPRRGVMRVSTCSPECRSYVRKCRSAGVTP